MYFIVTLGVGVGAVGQPKLGTLVSQVSLQIILFLGEFVNNPESCFVVP